mmetsp:Transcript_13105/g.19707  ORF Transcript_13105/g.19707 Transcript_13105/m.19707 type:complete len:91 (+) Transcript_13105:1488-1760(+)
MMTTGPSQQLEKWNRLKDRLQQLEQLTASFVKHQENLRKTLNERNKQALDEMNIFSLQRRLSFQSRLKVRSFSFLSFLYPFMTHLWFFIQ